MLQLYSPLFSNIPHYSGIILECSVTSKCLKLCWHNSLRSNLYLPLELGSTTSPRIISIRLEAPPPRIRVSRIYVTKVKICSSPDGSMVKNAVVEVGGPGFKSYFQ